MPANPPKGEEMNISSPVGGFAGLAGGDVGFWDIVKPMREISYSTHLAML